MVLSLCDADADFVLKGVCFTPAYFDDSVLPNDKDDDD